MGTKPLRALRGYWASNGGSKGLKSRLSLSLSLSAANVPVVSQTAVGTLFPSKELTKNRNRYRRKEKSKGFLGGKDAFAPQKTLPFLTCVRNRNRKRRTITTLGVLKPKFWECCCICKLECSRARMRESVRMRWSWTQRCATEHMTTICCMCR